MRTDSPVQARRCCGSREQGRKEPTPRDVMEPPAKGSSTGSSTKLFFSILAAFAVIVTAGPAVLKAFSPPQTSCLPACSGGKIRSSQWAANTASPIQDSTGLWQVELFTQGVSLQGMMQLQQIGSTITGRGEDASGVFAIEGHVVSPDTISFTKKYDQQSCGQGAHSQDILFEGKLSELERGLSCSGRYETRVKGGFMHRYFGKSHWTTIKDNWRAKRVSTATIATSMSQTGNVVVEPCRSQAQDSQIVLSPRLAN